jgi:hypothetical protein
MRSCVATGLLGDTSMKICGGPLSAKEVHVYPGSGARPALEKASLDKKAKPKSRLVAA